MFLHRPFHHMLCLTPRSETRAQRLQQLCDGTTNQIRSPQRTDRTMLVVRNTAGRPISGILSNHPNTSELEHITKHIVKRQKKGIPRTERVLRCGRTPSPASSLCPQMAKKESCHFCWICLKGPKTSEQYSV